MLAVSPLYKDLPSILEGPEEYIAHKCQNLFSNLRFLS